MAIRATDLTILMGFLLLAGAGIASSAERTDAREVLLRCAGEVPARIWTAVLVLPCE